MEEALIAQLLADSGLAALVGTRIYWGALPQGEPTPAVVLYRITPGVIATQKGVADLSGPLIQADCVGASFTEAVTVARALTAAFYALAAPFKRAFLETQRDDFEGEAPERRFRRSLDFSTWIGG